MPSFFYLNKLLHIGVRHQYSLNLNNVIKAHLGLFSDCKYQYVVFYVYPALIAIGLSGVYNAESNVMEQLNIVVSSLLSALLAIMSIIISKDISQLDNEGMIERAKNVITVTNNAIIFDVLVGVFSMIINLLLFAYTPDNLFRRIVTVVSYYLLIVMLITLLLIIKRLSKLSEL